MAEPAGIHPRHFVYEDDLAPVIGKGGKIVLKGIESVNPVLERGGFRSGICLECLGEVVKLVTGAEIVSSHELEIVFAFKKLLHKEGLADPSSSAYDYELRLIGIHAALQFLTFPLPGYQSVCHIIVFCAKVL